MVFVIVVRVCVLFVFLEFLFFNEGFVWDFFEVFNLLDKGLYIVEFVFFYCLLGLFLFVFELMMMIWFCLIFVGVFVGWLIEVVMVFVVYENLFFSFFWIFVFWYVMVDVCLGWVFLWCIFFVGWIKEKLLIVVVLGGLMVIWLIWVWLDLEFEVVLFI